MSLGKISTGDQTLQILLDSSSRAVRSIEEKANNPFGTVNLRDGYDVALNDIFIADPSDGAFTITLPSISYKDIGKVITVVNSTNSTNVIKVQSRISGTTISGSAFINMSTAYGWRVFLVISTSLWIEIGA